ncbi:MAG: peptide deformylase [Pelagibacterales bacterium]|nr:peptide deformylase [Pelagibacterales bacterium]OUU62867.1 MAG: peptide deformylase [Alphaproteobacteria bacterium TMED62]|tara:strand:+ start:3575 stop:4162 length:588 start_codon:yes stop_codon:yes gene_type:complete
MLQNLNIAQIGDPILRKKTRELSMEEIQSSSIKNIISKMIKTMRKYNGAGLAANQIFEPVRICIVEILENQRYRHLKSIPLKVLINPKIFIKKNNFLFNSYEGCLSVPNLRGKVKRYNEISITYYNSKGNRITENISGLESIVYQHEVDHLDGFLFTDKVYDNSSLVTYENYIKYYEEEYKKELIEFENKVKKLF